MRHLFREEAPLDTKDDLNSVVSLLITIPVVQETIRDIARELLAWELAESGVLEEVQEKVVSQITETQERAEKIKRTGRQQISTAKAARLMGYHPRYFCRLASKWGLTKIYMSSRSCRFYLDEIEAMIKERSYCEGQQRD